MNFFREQDQARRNTKRLFGLFLLAVIALIAVTNVLVAVTFWLVDGQLTSYSGTTGALVGDLGTSQRHYFTWENFGKISLMVCGAIVCAIAFKWLQLRSGGRRVAESLGGVRINPNTAEADMKRVLNVVEEMALASGMPVPSVYLLKGEKGINAFAAGNTPADAVIGVTQGALDQFNREQLQGVIAHEFSHILNGDMRLNLNMIALLHGILFVGGVGEFLMRSGGYHGHRVGRRGSDARVFMLGVALLVIGWLGMFFGGLIKAAISRQREFLADASAVQFTRNPNGIADALKIIGGYRPGSKVFSAKASEASHMFISEALGSLLRFDTHPPLKRRIKRIQPNWDGHFIQRDMKVVSPDSGADKPSAGDNRTQAAMVATTAAVLAAAGSVNEHADTAVQTSTSVIDVLWQQAQDPFGASALVFALLLSDDEQVKAKQLEYIKQAEIPGLGIQTLEFAPQIAQLDKTHRLPLLELAIPVLKAMSQQQYKRFKKILLLLIRADARFEMFEWCLYQLVRHYLGAEFEDSKPSQPIYKKAEQVADSYQLVLSMLAHHGHGDSDEKTTTRAFGRGANAAGLYTLELLPVSQCSLDEFVKAVNKLANCYPLLKPRLLKGLAQCVQHDGKITVEEKEMLSAIAAVMDCPMPRLLDEIALHNG